MGISSTCVTDHKETVLVQIKNWQISTRFQHIMWIIVIATGYEALLWFPTILWFFFISGLLANACFVEDCKRSVSWMFVWKAALAMTHAKWFVCNNLKEYSVSEITCFCVATNDMSSMTWCTFNHITQLLLWNVDLFCELPISRWSYLINVEAVPDKSNIISTMLLP